MRLVRSLVLTALAAGVLAGCITGERPRFAPDATESTTTTSTAAVPAPPAVGDAAVQAVLARLETPNVATFTATYSITTKLTPVDASTTPTVATVAQVSAAERSVTIGTTRYLQQAAGQSTCNLTSGACVTGLDNQPISNLMITYDFDAASPAAKLRQDLTTMVAAGTPSTIDVAGQQATCVAVAFAAGTKTYCALDGLLAYLDAPDVQIQLTALTATADPALFATTG